MTIRELIEYLQQYPLDTTIILSTRWIEAEADFSPLSDISLRRYQGDDRIGDLLEYRASGVQGAEQVVVLWPNLAEYDVQKHTM